MSNVRFANGLRSMARPFFLILLFLSIFLVANQVTAAPQARYLVTVTLDEAWSKTNADGWGDDDIYWRVQMKHLAGKQESISCGNEDMNISGEPHIKPNWTCVLDLQGGPDPAVEITLALWESDAWFTGADDHFDIHPKSDQKDLEMTFKPYNSLLSIKDISGWEAPGQCSLGGIIQEGQNGDDQAKVKFTVSSDIYGYPTGDADEDGLLNSWEICGVNTDNDNAVEIDLPGMGADPLHKDLFIEIDWMVDDNGGANDHSHEPWLPSLMNAWHEFEQAHVTNPDGKNGVALHLDVGNLYADYAIDFNGDGTNEIDVGANGVDVNGDGTRESLDMDNDGTADIGRLAALGNGSIGGGNRVPGNEDEVLNPHPTNGLCGNGSDLLNLRQNQFDPGRREVFRWSLFGHRHSNGTSTSSGVSCGGGETFAVTLATWGQEPGLTGPSGLPVEGLLEHHTGTFLHELGHSMGIGHGGNDGQNYKPNYLSLMNYHFQMIGTRYSFDGDLLADAILGQDYDHDGQDDIQRFIYSQQKLPTLDENNLNEAAGIGDNTMLTRVGPSAMDTDGGGTCDQYCGTAFEWALGNQAIDFSRGDHDNDGTANNDSGINRLTAPPNPANTLTDLNRDGAISRLDGFNDSFLLQNGGLVVGGGIPGFAMSDHDEVTLPQVEFVEANTSGVTSLPDVNFLRRRCIEGELNLIDFEDLRSGTAVTTQYAPLATFAGAPGTPTIADGAYRGGRPTQSPDHSLVNEPPGSSPGPLRISFGEPQRLVGLYLGRGEPGDPTQDFALLTAYDADGQVIGRVRRSLPPVNEGITAFLGAGAIFEDRPIARVELLNVGGATFEPAHIDNLLLCQEKKEDAPPIFPEPPKFGERPIAVNVEAELVTVGPANSEHQEPLLHTPLTHVPVDVEGQISQTGFSLTRYEGDSVTLAAPPVLDMNGIPLRFLHWVMDGQVIFPDEQTVISTVLLRDTVLKAVYRTEAEGCHFIVNSTADANDINIGDGACLAGRQSCTLRAAVEEANAQRGACLISVPAGTYPLTIGGLGEDQAHQGDLDLYGDLVIVGAGATDTVVDGQNIDTVFHVHEGRTAMLGLAITRGGQGGYPGGIENDGELHLGACRLWANGSPVWLGGGVLNTGVLTLIQCEVAYNVAHSGGGIFNYGDLTVLRSIFHRNEAQVEDGGAIANYRPGVARISDSALFFNTADRYGGGLWNGLDATLVNSTVSNNLAYGGGGGLANEDELSLNNVTVADNQAPRNEGGGLATLSGRTTAANSIFAGNSDEGVSAPDCLGPLQSTGFNLIENDIGCLIQGDTTGNIIGQPALIGPLALVPGDTVGHELLGGSPTLDKANPAQPGSSRGACEAHDQRGMSRPQNSRCDMGALEMPGKGEAKDGFKPQQPGYRWFLPAVRG